MAEPSVPIELLLAHRPWVRAVARAMCRDDADADDLEQEAWVAAIEGPPAHDESPRGWLRGVLRRRAAMRVRGDVRRDRREAVVARPESGSRAADELVAEAEIHARLAQAVVALAEPFRTAILLRYFEGLPPRDVAGRMDVPVETARSRIKRGLALLRAALGGDDERRAALLLAPLLRVNSEVPADRPLRAVRRTAAAAAVAGGVAMGIGTKLVAAAAVTACAAAAWWWTADDDASYVARTPEPPPGLASTETASRAATPTRRHAAPADVAEETPAPPAVSAVQPTRTIRWRIVAGEVPTPAMGTEIALEQMLGAVALPSGPRMLRVEGDDLVSEGLGAGTIQGFAVASDGSRAKLFAKDGDERGPDTQFLRERRVAVTLIEPNGDPASGVRLALRNQGNNIIRSEETDAQGRAVFKGLSPKDGRLLDVCVRWDRFDSRWLGTVDVTPGDVQVTWTVPAVRELTLRVSIDGERRIPALCTISVSDATIEVRQDDAARGDVHLRVRPERVGGEFRGVIGADGRASTTFNVSAGRDAAAIDVAIPRGVTFVGRLLTAKDVSVRVSSLRPGGSGPRVDVERLYEPSGRWGQVRMPGTVHVDGEGPDGDGMVRFKPLWLGSYRLRELASGVTSAVVDLSEDGIESPVVVLDLTRIGLVRGRVEAEGGSLADARVVFEGLPDATTGDASRRTVKVAADGTFEAWVPGDRTIRCRAEHPLLRPDGERGVAEVTQPADGLVLRLVPGPVVSFRLPGVDVPDAFHPVRVSLFRGEPVGDPATTRTVVSTRDGHRFGGFDAGRWTLWIDAPGRAPKTLRDVVLSEGATDLGSVFLDAGLSLRLRIATLPNEVAPRIGVTVSRKDGIAFSRFVSSRGESEVLVPGLVPGTYYVNVHPQTGSLRSDFWSDADPAPPYMRRTVVVSAASETVVEYSPR